MTPVNVTTFWLGPYFVEKRRSKIGRAGQAWQIVTRDGFIVKTRIPYKVDADTECAVLNLAGGVVRPPPVRCARTERRRDRVWTHADRVAAGRRGGLAAARKRRQAAAKGTPC